MIAVTLEEAQAQLPQLIDQVASGEEVVITRQDRPVAQLIPVAAAKLEPVFGRCRGMLIVNAEDDEHLKDFAEYMP